MSFNSSGAHSKCVATFDAATGVMTFTMILLPQTLANALVLEISPDDEEYQSYSNKEPGISLFPSRHDFVWCVLRDAPFLYARIAGERPLLRRVESEWETGKQLRNGRMGKMITPGNFIWKRFLGRSFLSDGTWRDSSIW